MNRNHHTLTLSITLEAPYLVHGNDPGRFGLDATLLRDHNRRPILPGTLVVGRIVEAWKSIGESLGNPDHTQWFGSEGGKRARLVIDDLVLKDWRKEDESQIETTRIRIDNNTGSVSTGAMLVIEQFAKAGKPLEFNGVWRVWATEEEISILVPQLRAALQLQTQFGAYRGVGFGRLISIAIESNKIACKSLSNWQTTQQKQRLALTSSQPLAVGNKSRRGNVFESDDIIPGGTILSAIACMLCEKHNVSRLTDLTTSKLAKHFNQIRCTHALPARKDNGRPIPLPQSLIATDNKIEDAFQCKEPPVNLKALPAFQTDWKTKVFEIARNNQGWGITDRYLRVRTAMDEEGKADEGKLFAYDCVVARPETEWQLEFDLSSVPDDDHTAIWIELEQLVQQGLFPIGKTDACVTLTPATEKNVWDSQLNDLKIGQLVSLTLVSDALLFPTASIADKTFIDLAALYKEAISGAGIEYSHHFATQRLAGGEYNWKHFNAKQVYQPWVLTEAGSVFALKVLDAAKAKATLQAWLKQGLPIPEKVRTAYGASWDCNPFIPQNGYSEIVINPRHGFPNLQTNIKEAK